MTTILETFSSYADGSTPTGWQTKWAVGDQMAVFDNPLGTDGKVAVYSVNETANARRAQFWTTPGAVGDYDFRCRFMLERAVSGNDFRIIGRGDINSTAGAETGVILDTASHATITRGKEVLLRNYNAGSLLATSGRALAPLEPYVWRQARVRCVGSTFYIGVWKEGDPEVELFSGTPTSVQATGYVGFGNFATCGFMIDCISIGYNGDVAPTLPPLPAIDQVTEPPTVTSVEAYNHGARIAWSPVSGASGYKVYRNGTPIADVTTGTSYLDDSSLSGGEHQYQVLSYIQE